MAKLWQKGYELDKTVESFTVGRDYLLDTDLVIADCLGSIAHARMLTQIGVLSAGELTALEEGLRGIIDLRLKNEFPIRREDEDCHTAIENHLVKTLGEAGKKIHTGRSRNDQVLTAIRVFGRDALLAVFDQALHAAGALVKRAEEHALTPMPGRTHMQTAMPSSVGLWFASFAEGIIDDLRSLQTAYTLFNQCPLGSAASYGVPLATDRELTAELLGFPAPQNNVLYVNNSRGKLEAFVLDALEHLSLTYSKFAQDLILFSLPEFGYFSLPDALCSGSSIMPQKKNPDGLELMRGKTATLGAYSQQIKGVIRSLPSGYNRDAQETKEPFLKGLELALQSAAIIALTAESVSVNREALKKAFTPDIFATDAALELVQKGTPFRDAYRKVGTSIESLQNRDPEQSITNRTATGTSGNLNLGYAVKWIDELQTWVRDENSRLMKAKSGLYGKEVSAFLRS